MTTGVFAAENGASKNTSADKFTPKVTYQVTVTDAERAKIHAAVARDRCFFIDFMM